MVGKKCENHDIDPVIIPLRANHNVKKPTLNTCRKWIRKFKIISRMKIRKIASVVTSINLKNEPIVSGKCADYIVNVKASSKEFSSACDYNSD